MEIEEIISRIYRISCPTITELASILVRFQEHYDSPKFKGKIFTLDEFMTWYAAFNNGKFTYYEDWLGFNFPSEVFTLFYDGKFDPLTEQENSVLNAFRGKVEKFYVIGTADDIEANPSTAAIKHEIAHGMFYTIPEYRKEISEELAKIDISPIKDALIQMNCGYNDDHYIMQDETHAYIIDGPDYMKSEDVRVKDADKYAQISARLNEIFQKYLDKESGKMGLAKAYTLPPNGD